MNEISVIDEEIHQLDFEIRSLSHRRKQLQEKKNAIIKSAQEEKRLIRESKEPNWQSSNFPWSGLLHGAAATMFDFQSIRPCQLEVINAALSRYDVLAVMKTGGGKSLCYQLPALAVDEGFTLIVSPLVALIRDQLRCINDIAPNAARSLAGNMERSDQNEVYRAMDTCSGSYSSGQLRLLYVTPEKVLKSKLLMTHLQRAYDRQTLVRIVIDEAHCASQWGHDFRPDYAKLHILRAAFPVVPLLLLTATANHAVRQDLVNMLHLGTDSDNVSEFPEQEWQDDVMVVRNVSSGSGPGPVKGLKTFLGDFDRPNLTFEVWRKPLGFEDAIHMVIRALSCIPSAGSSQSSRGAAIVYCFSQRECESVADELRKHNVRSCAYHAGMNDSLRNRCQDAWTEGEITVICATIAFGLGINMPTVRVVVHFTLSKSLELYYQEAGRAGRDNRPSLCVVLYSPGDVMRVAAMAVGDVEVHRLSTGRAYTRPKVMSMASYCHSRLCRRAVFDRGLRGESGPEGLHSTPSIDCCVKSEGMAICDNCRRGAAQKGSDDVNGKGGDVLRVVQTLIEAVRQSVSSGSGTSGGLTMKKLSVTSPVKTSAKAFLGGESSESPQFLAEYMIIDLISCGVFEITFNFTPYTTLCYISLGVTAVPGDLSSSSKWELPNSCCHFTVLPLEPLPLYNNVDNWEADTKTVRLKRKTHTRVNRLASDDQKDEFMLQDKMCTGKRIKTAPSVKKTYHTPEWANDSDNDDFLIDLT